MIVWEAALESLQAVNEALRGAWLPPSVRDDVRARLQLIEETLRLSRQLAADYRPVHSSEIVEGLGLSREQQLAVQMRVAQAFAQGCVVPSGHVRDGDGRIVE